MEKVVKKLRMPACRKKQVDAGQVQEEIISALSSFALYGFPESHAISFALLAYASCWLKVHRAPEFYCGLLNNQPMGFYSPATLVKDATRRGVKFRPVCVVHSGRALPASRTDGSIRLGLNYTRKACIKTAPRRLVRQRAFAPFCQSRRSAHCAFR